ncbi:MAG: pyridoxine 5'-phosphate synthase [Deltaproteobacteria bacterium]|nr:MAG: pyridoxine 5'-phosphate synthase [Deltaproteobacteria bacterium]
MIRLGVNIDHVATVRQARGVDYPDPVAAAAIVEMAGADGIVVHLREDRRHIHDRDLEILRKTVKSKLNLEMAANDEIIEIALKTGPDMVTIVPERRQELTTEGGLDVEANYEKLVSLTERMHAKGIFVSMFIDPEPKAIELSKKMGSDAIELHTGRYCDAPTPAEQQREYERIRTGVEEGLKHGLQVNAGHGLHYFNVKPIAAIPGVEELNIGHSIIARAIFVGLDRAVRDMKALMEEARRG